MIDSERVEDYMTKAELRFQDMLDGYNELCVSVDWLRNNVDNATPEQQQHLAELFGRYEHRRSRMS